MPVWRLNIGNVKGAIGGLRYQVENAPENYGHLVDKDGKWIVRDDVKVWWRDSDITAPRAVLKGDQIQKISRASNVRIGKGSPGCGGPASILARWWRSCFSPFPRRRCGR